MITQRDLLNEETLSGLRSIRRAYDWTLKLDEDIEADLEVELNKVPKDKCNIYNLQCRLRRNAKWRRELDSQRIFDPES